MSEILLDHVYYKIGTQNQASVSRVEDKSLQVPINIQSYINIDNNEYEVTSIQGSSFFEAKITSLKIPSTIKEIGAYAFDRCKKLTGTLELPHSIQTIGEQAFSSTSYERVILHKELKSITPTAFCTMDKLNKFIVDQDNNYYCADKYGCLYSKNLTVLYQYVLTLPFFAVHPNTLQIASKALAHLPFQFIHIPSHVIRFEVFSLIVLENSQEVHLHSQWYEAEESAFSFASSNTQFYYYGSKIENELVIKDSAKPKIFVSQRYLAKNYSAIPVSILTQFPKFPIPTCKSTISQNTWKYCLIIFLQSS